MMGLEPTTFCMASRRSSQLSYIRAHASIAAVFSGAPRPPVAEDLGTPPVHADDRQVGLSPVEPVL